MSAEIYIVSAIQGDWEPSVRNIAAYESKDDADTFMQLLQSQFDDAQEQYDDYIEENPDYCEEDFDKFLTFVEKLKDGGEDKEKDLSETCKYYVDNVTFAPHKGTVSDNE